MKLFVLLGLTGGQRPSSANNL